MFADTFHKTMEEAMDEVARRRADPRGMELVTRIERSPTEGATAFAPWRQIFTSK
jgi:hypothetical protein